MTISSRLQIVGVSTLRSSAICSAPISWLIDPICLSGAEAGPVVGQAPLPIRGFENRAVNDNTRLSTVLNIEDGLHIGGPVAGEALIGPAKRMRGEYDVIEFEDRIIGIRRLGFENIEPGACDAPFLQGSRQ